MAAVIHALELIAVQILFAAHLTVKGPIRVETVNAVLVVQRWTSKAKIVNNLSASQFVPRSGTHQCYTQEVGISHPIPMLIQSKQVPQTLPSARLVA